MLIKCPECGHQVSDRAKTCPSCGIAIAGQVTRCPACGEFMFKHQSNCPHCHSQHQQDADEQEEDAGREESETPRKKSRRGLWSALVVAFLLALAAVLALIFFYQKTQDENEQRAFENAVTSKEAAVLQNFLDMYTDASPAHRDSVKACLEVLRKVDRDWQNVRISQSKSALQAFIRNNPENMHVPEANLLIDSIDFATAKYVNTMEAFRKYMDEHSQGNYYDEASNEYDRLSEEAKLERLKASQDSIRALQRESLLNVGE